MNRDEYISSVFNAVKVLSNHIVLNNVSLITNFDKLEKNEQYDF